MTAFAEAERLLTPAQVAERLNVPEVTLTGWRNRNVDPGPPWKKVGPRLVRYPEQALERWLANQEGTA